jgi:hypothetical protein
MLSDQTPNGKRNSDDLPQPAIPDELLRAEEEAWQDWQEADARALLVEQLGVIADRIADLDRRAGGTDAERQEASTEFPIVESQLGDLFLLLLRLAALHHPDVLRRYLSEAIREDLEPLAQAITELEARL